MLIRTRYIQLSSLQGSLLFQQSITLWRVTFTLWVSLPLDVLVEHAPDFSVA
jgi:hypothetical protein